jgi:hypothetical protein
MEGFNGHCTVEIKYRRVGGEWKLIHEYIPASIRNLDPPAIERVKTIDLGMACGSKRRRTSAEKKRLQKEAIPWKHTSLLIEAIRKLGLYPKSIQTRHSGKVGENGEEYHAVVIVEKFSPRYIHLG